MNDDSSKAWVQTFTGKQFFPMNPSLIDIEIEDIAHALAHQCRFSGHCSRHYSVAEHSLRVFWELRRAKLPASTCLKGLLHDASEAYLVDIPSPLKRLPEFAAYRAAEDVLQGLCFRRFGLTEEMPAEVKHMDLVLLATEKKFLMGQEPASWGTLSAPLPVSFFDSLSWGCEHSVVKELFVDNFRETLREVRE